MHSGLPPIPEAEALVLRTDRLDLLPVTREHAAGMYEILKDIRLYEFTEGSPPADVGSLTRVYEFWERRLSPDGSELWLNWAIRLRNDDAWIGHLQAGVHADHANIAWVVGLRWQCQGYATEAARAVLEWLIQFGVREIRASIHPAHAASIKVAERLGLRRTSEIAGQELIWKRHRPS